jgi:uncharacterized coiled-coil DUF342 family protein
MVLAMSAALSRDTVDALEAQLRTFLVRHQEVQGEREELAARVAALERARDELAERLRRYECERVEIRSRLARILTLMGMP